MNPHHPYPEDYEYTGSHPELLYRQVKADGSTIANGEWCFVMTVNHRGGKGVKVRTLRMISQGAMDAMSTVLTSMGKHQQEPTRTLLSIDRLNEAINLFVSEGFRRPRPKALEDYLGGPDIRNDDQHLEIPE